MITALSGTRMLRNTAINSRKLSSSTTPSSHGMRSPMYAAKSDEPAVAPPTLASTPVAGITSSRRASTRSSVSASCGAAVGVEEDEGEIVDVLVGDVDERHALG